MKSYQVVPWFLAKARFKGLVGVAALLLTTAPVLAGQYDLIKGKGVEVCEAYKKNLESFSDRYPVMACERKINPAFTDFETPNWEKLDLEKHRELFRRVLRSRVPIGISLGEVTGWTIQTSIAKSRITSSAAILT